MTQPSDLSLEALSNALDALGSTSTLHTVDDVVERLEDNMRDVFVLRHDGSWELEDLASKPVAFVVSTRARKFKLRRRSPKQIKWGSTKGWLPLHANIPPKYKSRIFERTHRKRSDKKYNMKATRIQIGPGLWLFAIVCTKRDDVVIDNPVIPTRRDNDTPTFPDCYPGCPWHDVPLPLTTDETLSESPESSESEESIPSPPPIKRVRFAPQNTVVAIPTPTKSSSPGSPKRKREVEVEVAAEPVAEPAVKKAKALDGTSNLVGAIDFDALADKLQIQEMIQEVLNGDDHDDEIEGYAVPATEMIPFQPLFSSSTLGLPNINSMVNMSYPSWNPFNTSIFENPMYDIPASMA